MEYGIFRSVHVGDNFCNRNFGIEINGMQDTQTPLMDPRCYGCLYFEDCKRSGCKENKFNYLGLQD